MSEIRQQTIAKYCRFLNIIKANEGKGIKISHAVSESGVCSLTPSAAQKLGLIKNEGRGLYRANYKSVEPIMARRIIETVNKYAIEKRNPISEKPTDIVPYVSKRDDAIPAPSPQRKEVELRIFGIPVFKYIKL